MRLGKLAPRHDSRTLRLARYLAPDLPPPPDSVDWGKGVKSWPMLLNDQLGDCTCAAAGHMIKSWTCAASGKAVTITDAEVRAAYDRVNGGRDGGAVELDVLKMWRRTGIGSHKIVAFAAVDVQSAWQVRQALHLFGGLYLGIALPLSAQGQDLWHVTDPRLVGPSAPGGWGGHAVGVVAYEAKGLWIVTWGKLVFVTWAFFLAYCDEAWAVLSQDWIDAAGQAPSGFALDVLLADLSRL